MCRCTIESTNMKFDIDVKPSADFVTCIIPALLSALPAFIQAFMSCLSGGTSGGSFNPGDRVRCK